MTEAHHEHSDATVDQPSSAALLGLVILSGGGVAVSATAILVNLGIGPFTGAVPFVIGFLAIAVAQVLTGAQMNKADITRRDRTFIFEMFGEQFVGDCLASAGRDRSKARTLSRTLRFAPFVAFAVFCLVFGVQLGGRQWG